MPRRSRASGRAARLGVVGRQFQELLGGLAMPPEPRVAFAEEVGGVRRQPVAGVLGQEIVETRDGGIVTGRLVERRSRSRIRRAAAGHEAADAARWRRHGCGFDRFGRRGRDGGLAALRSAHGSGRAGHGARQRSRGRPRGRVPACRRRACWGAGACSPRPRNRAVWALRARRDRLRDRRRRPGAGARRRRPARGAPPRPGGVASATAASGAASPLSPRRCSGGLPPGAAGARFRSWKRKSTSCCILRRASSSRLF